MHQCFIAITLLILTGCEPFYDPVERGDVPTSQGSSWNKIQINVKKTVEPLYEASDLTGDMPLSRLLDIALYNNPSTRASWNAARASAYAYRLSLSDYYPTILYDGTLNAQTNKGTSFANSGGGVVTEGGTTATGTITPTPVPIPTEFKQTNIFNELSLTYLLLDFGGRCATAELALQTLYASNWQHNYTMQQVMLSVLNAYTSYLGNQGLVAAYKENLKDAEVALNAAQVMRKYGLSTLNDVLLAQSNVEQTKTNLIQSEGAEKTSLGELFIALGLPADTEISIQQLPQELPIIEIAGNLSSLLEYAKSHRPDLGIAIAAIKQQEAELAISYSSSMPTLGTNLTWNQLIFISPKRPPGYNEVASLSLDFPIFQGFYYMNQQRQLRAQVEEAVANLDVQVAAVSTQVVTSYYSFLSAEGALPSSQAAVDYARRSFKGFTAQYKTGASSILDVLTALTTLSNARAQLVLTRTQWAASLANLAFSVGALDETGGMWKKNPPKELYQLPITDQGDAE